MKVTMAVAIIAGPCQRCWKQDDRYSELHVVRIQVK